MSADLFENIRGRALPTRVNYSEDVAESPIVAPVPEKNKKPTPQDVWNVLSDEVKRKFETKEGTIKRYKLYIFVHQVEGLLKDYRFSLSEFALIDPKCIKRTGRLNTKRLSEIISDNVDKGLLYHEI